MRIEFDECPEDFYSYGEFLSKNEDKVFVQACHPIEGEKTVSFLYDCSWSECGEFKLERAFHEE